LLRLYDLHERARVDAQEQADADQEQQSDASASKLGPGAHAAAILDVRTLLLTSPAQLALSCSGLGLELVVDALAAALEEAREVLRPNRDFAELACQRAACLRTDVAVDIDTGVLLEVPNCVPRSLAHHSVMLSRLVPTDVERLLQCCGVVI
jgi:hypothetical protein